MSGRVLGAVARRTNNSAGERQQSSCTPTRSSAVSVPRFVLGSGDRKDICFVSISNRGVITSIYYLTKRKSGIEESTAIVHSRTNRSGQRFALPPRRRESLPTMRTLSIPRTVQPASRPPAPRTRRRVSRSCLLLRYYNSLMYNSSQRRLTSSTDRYNQKSEKKNEEGRYPITTNYS